MIKRIKSRLLMFIAAIVLVGGLAVPIGVMNAEDAAAASAKYSGATYKNNTYFTVSGMVGTCSQMNKDMTTSGTATITRLANTTIRAKTAYQLGYVTGWDKQLTQKRVIRIM